MEQNHNLGTTLALLLSLVVGVGPAVASDAPAEQALVEPAAPESPEQVPDSGVEVNQPASFPEYHGSIETYQKDIVIIEDRHGVYDYRLVPQLTGIGLSLQGQGEHGPAIDAFKRALHLSRINEGLHSLGQVPILTHLIDSYSAINEWELASDKQAYVFDLQKRNYGSRDPRLLEPIGRMIRWHLKAYWNNWEEVEDPVEHLLKARRLNQLAINIIESNFGSDDLRLSDALYEYALTNYELARFSVTGSASFRGPEFGPHRRTNISYDDDDAFRDAFSVNGYGDGRKALEKRADIYDKNPDLPIQDKALALVELGDWYLAFGKPDSAMRVYRQVHERFSAHDDTREIVEQLFGQPQALQFEYPEKQEFLMRDGGSEGFVKAEFNVTPSGYARNIKIVESNPPDFMDSTVRKTIRAARYRPRIIDGKAVLTKGFTLKHVFTF